MLLHRFVCETTGYGAYSGYVSTLANAVNIIDKYKYCIALVRITLSTGVPLNEKKHKLVMISSTKGASPLDLEDHNIVLKRVKAVIPQTMTIINTSNPVTDVTMANIRATMMIEVPSNYGMMFQ